MEPYLNLPYQFQKIRLKNLNFVEISLHKEHCLTVPLIEKLVGSMGSLLFMGSILKISVAMPCSVAIRAN